ncbi:hypothetical protein E2C01_074011 [Portunus trituberculatus]|uniref:Uncharacterized protein n=1 Tax=Portunus trituberculatus TaxID=210409 RepID=A0A5B7I293_PORTR|nr:hypothetical protein [Portunus trituberculatus]
MRIVTPSYILRLASRTLRSSSPTGPAAATCTSHTDTPLDYCRAAPSHVRTHKHDSSRQRRR